MASVFKPFKSFQLDNFRKSLGVFNTNINANNYLYVFASRATPFANNDFIAEGTVESINESAIRPYREMMFGKRVENTDIAYLLKNYTWTTGTFYAKYDDQDTDLYNKQFYVISKFNPNYGVYKCLDNNNNSASTVDPGSYPNGYITPFLPFTTSDGYVWKFMFAVPTSYYNKFNFASNYIPYFPPDFITPGDDLSQSKQVQVTSNNGIDVLVLVNAGNNYTSTSNGILQSIDSTNTVIRLQSSASTANSVYVGSAILLKDLSGSNTFLRNILTYYGTNNTLVVDSAVPGVTGLNYTYSIAPAIKIQGDGTGAQAFCNTINGQIYSLKILNSGTGYTRADIIISPNNVYGSGASVRAVIPPPGGHGNNAVNELGISTIGITSTFTGSESNTIPYNLIYRSVGLLKNGENIGAPSHPYSNTTFNQTIDVNFTNPITFNVPDIVTGSASFNQGIVVFSNSTLTTLVGDKNFIPGETLTNSNGTISATLSSITRTNNIVPFTGDILYLNNINKIIRSSSNNETIQIAVQL